MKTVYKYPLTSLSEEQVIQVPEKFRPLSVQVQRNGVMLWAEVDTDHLVDRQLTIFLRGTGHPVPQEPHAYLGTVQLMGGELVLHVSYATKFEPRVRTL